MFQAQIDERQFESLLGSVSHSLLREQQGEFYIIDPNGYIMMHYAADSDPKGILKDLKRLLSVSKSH